MIIAAAASVAIAQLIARFDCEALYKPIETVYDKDWDWGEAAEKSRVQRGRGTIEITGSATDKPSASINVRVSFAHIQPLDSSGDLRVIDRVSGRIHHVEVWLPQQVIRLEINETNQPSAYTATWRSIGPDGPGPLIARGRCNLVDLGAKSTGMPVQSEQAK